MAIHIRRREFIAAVGGAAVWPLVARAQQRPMPVIGFLGSASSDLYTTRLHAFHEGLSAAGYVEGKNIHVEYRWAEGHNDRLPELAVQLVHQQVAVLIAGGGTASALAAKAATVTIPIVFAIATDPVSLGLVTGLNRPGGNVTGVASLNIEVGPKRLELLHELLPSTTVMALLVNPADPAVAEPVSRAAQAAAHDLGVQLHVVHASSERDFDAVFATLSQLHAGALLIGADNLFTAHIEELAALTVRHMLPAIYEFRQFVSAGGLMSYGTSQEEYYRLVGNYTGRILKGEKPADLPVQQLTKVELLINLKTAKALGLEVPMSLLMRVNEVIE
jgi:putative tryptophan/tyrosine transport system substrate-binding protein